MAKVVSTPMRCPCGNCGYPIEFATSFKGRAPKSGDLIVCLNCTAVSRFDQALKPVHIPDPILVKTVDANVLRAIRFNQAHCLRVTGGIGKRAKALAKMKRNKHGC